MGAECVGGETPIPDSIKSVYESDRRKWKLQRQEEGALLLSHTLARSLTVSFSLFVARRRLLNLIKTVCRPKRHCLALHKSQLSAADGKHNLHVYNISTRTHIIRPS